MSVRDSQETILVVSTPNTAKIRDSQETMLVVSRPSTAKIRDSQEVILLVLGQLSQQPRVYISS